MDTTTSVAAAAAPAGSMTRAQVAEYLGISITGVRRREGRSLHPTRGAKGERLFDRGEVEAERQREGRTSALSSPSNRISLSDNEDYVNYAPIPGEELHGTASLPVEVPHVR